MRALRLALRQLPYEHRAFIRNPAAAFFTLIFPLIFLVIFNLLFGNDTLTIQGGETKTSTFYVPAIAAFSVINACYTGLAMQIALARDQGQLKRVGGTPLPKLSYLLGKVIYMVGVAVFLVVLVVAFGAAFYDVDVPDQSLPAFLVALATGAAAFAALAFATVAFIPNADASSPVINGIILPLFFISDVFIPLDSETPTWINWAGNVFPIKHLSLSLQTAFNPFSSGAGWELGHLAIVALWGVAGMIVALRYFNWEPRV
ncbi:MAG: ABC transporter permease [Dehalococcoidia bacterium]